MNKGYETVQIAEKPLYKTGRSVRIPGLDFLRGLCIILMMLDHASFNFMWLSEWSLNFHELNNRFILGLHNWTYDYWWESKLRMTVRIAVIFIFFAISGICSSFSRNNFLRGIKVGVASIVLSLFTILADTFFDLGITILFGVLHCFTVSTLIYALLEFLLKDKSLYACIGLGILIYVWGIQVDFYNLQYNNPLYEPLSVKDCFSLIAGTGYIGADCFGIIPYTGMFLIGAAGGKLLYRYRRPYLPVFDAKPFRPLCFVGRNAIWFYLLHQPVIFSLTILISMSAGLKFF